MWRRVLPAILAVVIAIVSPVGAQGAGNSGDAAANGQGKARSSEHAKAGQAKGGNAARADSEGLVNGKSPSTPDQDGVGMDRGIVNNDKTGSDTDGNNGCGNDPDREDDNNGWCGNQPAPQRSPPSVGGENEEQEQAEEAQPTAARVLGVRLTRSAPRALGEQLARTGLAIVPVFALVAALLLVGLAARRAGRRRRVG